MTTFHPLEVADSREEIPGVARTVVFGVPGALRDAFRWLPGQHITLRFRIGGREVRRPYSVSASPDAGDPLRITVKRVAGGLVSNHVNDTLKAGSRVEVMPPFGGFTLVPDPRRRRTCYLIGAGSGITPLYAMLRSVLAAEPWSAVHLLYGNHDAASVLFAGELSRLQAEHPVRLSVSHVLSRPGRDAACWRGGRIDAAAIEAWIAEYPPYAQDARYFVCGPGRMNGTVASALAGMDVPAGRIRMESYGKAVEVDDAVAGVASTAEIVLGNRRRDIPVAAGQTILDAARAAGLDAPYSCEAGVCGACRAELTAGSVHMRAAMALTEEERAGGAVLTCQSVATSTRVGIRFPPGGSHGPGEFHD